jgi:hypothetical protein
MEVQFVRVGNHRYSVVVHRAGHPSVEMNPAPGYDDLMPHDLLHFVVERHLKLRRGIFGQLATGGTAGTFRLVSPASTTREQSRRARNLSRRGAKLARDGQADCVVSEYAAQVCHQAWSTGARATAQSRLGTKVGADLVLTPEQLESVCAELEELSAAWKRLEVGQALTLVWPDSIQKKY